MYEYSSVHGENVCRAENRADFAYTDCYADTTTSHMYIQGMQDIAAGLDRLHHQNAKSKTFPPNTFLSRLGVV